MSKNLFEGRKICRWGQRKEKKMVLFKALKMCGMLKKNKSRSGGVLWNRIIVTVAVLGL